MYRVLKRVATNPYIPHTPTYKQAAFLALPHQEALYGGAAGGGKSDALLMAALLFMHEYPVSAIIFRRTYTDLILPEALMDRAADWLSGTDARWVGSANRWDFPNGGTLSFGYLMKRDDKYRYQSSAFQVICFDELTQFTLDQYLYLKSRLRRLAGFPVPLWMRSATNPGGRGHA